MGEDPQSKQAVQDAYEHAAYLIRVGKSRKEIRANLREELELSEDDTKVVLDNLYGMRAKAIREAGRKNMLYGALWCIGGTLVTVFSYQAASNDREGGTYLVAWGAIAFGGVQFFRGLVQVIRGD